MPLGKLVAGHGRRCDHRRDIGKIVADENLVFGAARLDDAPDAAVRDGTAEKGDFALPGQQHVGYEAAAAVQMAGVLLALDPGSDALRHIRSRCKATAAAAGGLVTWRQNWPSAAVRT